MILPETRYAYLTLLQVAFRRLPCQNGIHGPPSAVSPTWSVAEVCDPGLPCLTMRGADEHGDYGGGDHAAGAMRRNGHPPFGALQFRQPARGSIHGSPDGNNHGVLRRSDPGCRAGDLAGRRDPGSRGPGDRPGPGDRVALDGGPAAAVERPAAGDRALISRRLGRIPCPASPDRRRAGRRDTPPAPRPAWRSKRPGQRWR
jgi:hypothetical protein